MESFASRHIGPRQHEITQMLRLVGVSSITELVDRTLPKDIRLSGPLSLPEGMSETTYAKRLRRMASQNKLYRTYIGLGYYNTLMPPVIQRNILENPSWYTSYTPYQAEISQGRLEALLNFQTVITELTAMDIANASLLDESQAAAEAMILMHSVRSREAVKNDANQFFVDKSVFPQTLDVIVTRAQHLGIQVIVDDYLNFFPHEKVFGVMVQYPNADGAIDDYRQLAQQAHSVGAKLGVIADLMSLAILTPPGNWGADVVVGSSQRFGVPMGYGGPHAAFFATKDEFKRSMPGRIIGVSIDAQGKRALRMALQTREQHIKRERATSNICTAQALLATMAGMYAVYHGPTGIRNIALYIHRLAATLSDQLSELGYRQLNRNFFDTIQIELSKEKSDQIEKLALEKQINFRYSPNGNVWISVDESTNVTDINDIIAIFAQAVGKQAPVAKLKATENFDRSFARTNEYLTHKVFNSYHSETGMMRYIKKLERKDISLTHSMIPLGSCTMKLNAAAEMFALSWPEFGNMHPFVPLDQAKGYQLLIEELSRQLAIITGFDSVSFQPNSGATGEYTGLLVIQAYHAERMQYHRNVVLIPSSAHGTNPASAAMAGMKIITVPCDNDGNIDIAQLKALAEANKDNLSCLMITYPSTHGVFEEGVREIINEIHQCGGLVYMDGANMNAQVGLTNPGFLGADVCHLNLHKTFAIPHGGGGPGMGPICVTKQLSHFLPSHAVMRSGGYKGITAVAESPWGSASILTISHAYISLMGNSGLRQATCMAILNANYLAQKLKGHFQVLFTNKNGMVAHELILDCDPFKDTGIVAADIAKRLMDFGFHAPTLSFPVANTLMVEPTESESLQELDRFVAAMIRIHEEIQEIANNQVDPIDNILKHAPHTEQTVVSDQWNRPYSREKAAYPLEWVRENKFWPASGRVDDAYGDRNLVCTCEK